MPEYAIEVKDLCINYRSLKSYSIKKNLLKGKNRRAELFEAVKHVNFQVEKGEILGLIGKNGSGKSTMLRAIAGIFSPNSGTIDLHGNSVSLLAIGAGFYLVAGLAFLAVMLTITVLARIEQRAGHGDTASYYVELEDLHTAREFYNSIGEQITSVELVPARSGLPGHVGLELMVASPQERRAVFDQLQHNEQVAIALPIHS